ncbi:MAG: HEAT repeat domain-containing protein [Gaiellaceae bacterium]
MTRDPTEADWLKRRLAILAAKDRGDVSYLLGALLDPDHRTLAAKSLGEFGAVEATEPLLRLLDAVDPHVRAEAATTLGQLGAQRALPRLREIALADEEAFVRSWAIGAIGSLGDPNDLDFLLPMLNDPSWRVRAASVQALGRIGDPRALEPLRGARRRLRRSPVEWYLYRRLYSRTINALTRGSADDAADD